MQHRQGRSALVLATALLALCGVRAARADSGREQLQRVQEVLATHCASCHSGQGQDADRGGFDRVLDLPALARGPWVVAGKPDQSELYQRLRDGEMPPAKVRPRPSADEVETVRLWIAQGAMTPTAAERPSSRQLARWMAADLRRLSPARRQHARYILVAHLERESDRQLLSAAVSKLVNSLSWRRRLHRPVSVGGGALLRIDLRALGWSLGTWERLARQAPTSSVEHGGAWREVHLASRTYAPLVAGDWLVHAASSPALYHQLLSIPADLRVLRGRLGLTGSAPQLRSGFNGSGVSQHNRLIEREALPEGGYYWRSYDFASSQGHRNLFENPLGAQGQGLVADGGEIIFSLPNGLQGYMLVDRRGRRIEQAPTSIVVDRKRADSAVRNGVSCMGCHDGGVVSKRDQIRDHVLRNRSAFELRDPGLLRRVLLLHRPAAELDRVFAADRARFAAALARLGSSRRRGEPIESIARGYERDVDRSRAARELGVDRSALAKAIAGAGARRRLGALMVQGGTVAREVWDVQVPRLLDALGRTRLDGLPADAELDLVCEAGSGLECFRLADRFYRGRAVAPDLARALRLYRASCERNYAAGCTAVGLLIRPGAGRGLPENASSSRWALSRGCELGHLRGCERLGRMLLAGRGVAKNRVRARQLLQDACRGGRAGACTISGDLRYHGIGGRVDHSGALALYDRGCDRGASRSCRNAATLYRRGLGTRTDLLRSAGYLGRACDLRDLRSCTEAASLAAGGRGVRQDHRLAARYHQRACELGSGQACRKLAQQYRWGKGVRVDWARSERLFRKACRLGHQAACVYL